MRLIATSWSDNPRKGVDVLEWLDRNLDRDPEVTFAGRTQAKFESIRWSRRSTSVAARRALLRDAGRLSRRQSRRPVLERAARSACVRAARGLPREAADIRSSSARPGSGSTRRRSCPECSGNWRASSKRGARRFASPSLPTWPTATSECCADDESAAPAGARRVRACAHRAWPEASRLFVVGDDFGWSIDDDRERLTATAQRLGYDVAPAGWARFSERQAVFHHDHFGALQPRWLESSHRLGLSYFHGRPGTAGYPEFDQRLRDVEAPRERIDRVQVTHAEMHELVLAAGVAPEQRPSNSDRSRHRAVPAGRRELGGSGRGRSWRSRVGLRRRLVRQGRRRPGRRARAEAGERAGHARRRA